MSLEGTAYETFEIGLYLVIIIIVGLGLTNHLFGEGSVYEEQVSLWKEKQGMSKQGFWKNIGVIQIAKQ